MTSLLNLVYPLLSKLAYYFEGSYTHRIILSAWRILSQLWFFMALGILLTALLSVLVPKGRMTSFFLRRGNLSILLAALFGVISPFGTYSVIPLIAAFFLVGVPPAPLVAFLISSPLMNPNLFFLTAGAFGYEMAILRSASALLLGISSGYITQMLISMKLIDRHGLVSNPSGNVRQTCTTPNERETESPCISHFPKELFNLTRFVGKYMCLSILFASIISVFAPPSLVAKLLGSDSVLSVLFATGAGMPFYTCGGAAIPVVQELHYLGMSKGAIMAFFIAGPATKIATLVTLKAAFRASLFLIYVTVTITGALVIGYLCNVFL